VAVNAGFDEVELSVWLNVWKMYE